MRMRIGALVTVVLAAVPAAAQFSGRETHIEGRHFTNPAPPSRQALDRLNLKLGWRVYLPVAGKRDGIFSIQIADRQIFVQTVSGLIIALDAETGLVGWKTQVGEPYRVRQTLGYNKRHVFAVRADKLHAVERATGKALWNFTLPEGPSAAPVADDEGVYLCLGTGRIYAYILPDLKEYQRQEEGRRRYREAVTESRRSGGISSGIGLENLAEMRREPGPQPELAWSLLSEGGRVALTPLQTADTLFVAASGGRLFSAAKFVREERYKFKTEAPMTAPLGQHGDSAYAASQDYNLYAIDIPTGHFLWRFAGGSEILTQPAVLDRDVFIAPDRRGLYRLDRETGNEVWHNRFATQFLAMNKRFVYALDRSGHLLVLDKDRGTQLGMLNTRDFTLPIRNELTDRVYLAAHNGLLICLHDHQQRLPLVNKKVEERKAEGFRPEEKKKKDKEEKPKEKKPMKKEEDKEKE